MTTENLERAFASTRSVLANLTTDQLTNATPCQSWQVRDLVNHIIGTTFWFAGAVNTGTAPPIEEIDFTTGNMVLTYDDGLGRAVAQPAEDQRIGEPSDSEADAPFLARAR